MAARIFLLSLAGYLLGSIPFAYLVSRWWKGVDIRRVGSRNPGGANVLRQVGKLPGAVVILGDLLKGLVPILVAKGWGLPWWGVAIIGVMPVLGHNYPVFLGFDGGEGVLTSMGVLLGAMPGKFGLAMACGVVAGSLSGRLRLSGWFGSRINFGAVVGFGLLFLLIGVGGRWELLLLPGLLSVVLILRQLQTLHSHGRDF